MIASRRLSRISGQVPHKIERDDFSSNRHPALSFCLSMISAQTLRVCREGKPVPTFPDHALEPFGRKARAYSHSIVPGGFDVASYTTRLWSFEHLIQISKSRTHVRVRSRGARRPGCASTLSLQTQRAWGTPGARGTRSLVFALHW